MQNEKIANDSKFPKNAGIKECEWSKIPEKCGIKECELWTKFAFFNSAFFCSAGLFSALLSSLKVANGFGFI